MNKGGRYTAEGVGRSIVRDVRMGFSRRRHPLARHREHRAPYPVQQPRPGGPLDAATLPDIVLVYSMQLINSDKLPKSGGKKYRENVSSPSQHSPPPPPPGGGRPASGASGSSRVIFNF